MTTPAHLANLSWLDAWERECIVSGQPHKPHGSCGGTGKFRPFAGLLNPQGDCDCRLGTDDMEAHEDDDRLVLLLDGFRALPAELQNKLNGIIDRSLETEDDPQGEEPSALLCWLTEASLAAALREALS